MALRILIADDEKSIVMAVTRLLERAGHEVMSAGTADEALALVDGHRFDVALVDANMPGDGRTILRSLAERPDFDGRMVLMTGGLPQEIDRVPSEAVRLQKPFDFATLLDLLGDS